MLGEHSPFTREADGIRWYRCLRCEAWVPLEKPIAPTVPLPPAADDIKLPIRGRKLRDRYVLRVIVLERTIHALILAAIVVAIFLFAQHRAWLHETYIKILTALQGGVGSSSASSHSGLVYDLNHLFKLSTGTIYLIGVAVDPDMAPGLCDPAVCANQNRRAKNALESSAIHGFFAPDAVRLQHLMLLI